MQSVIFNYVKQVILIAVVKWHIKKMLMACANTIGSDQFAHPVGFKKTFAVRTHYVWTTRSLQALNNGHVSILRILNLR